MVLVNDIQNGSYVPVLDITFNDSDILIMQKRKTILSCIISLSAYYYNPYVSRLFKKKLLFFICLIYLKMGTVH